MTKTLPDNNNTLNSTMLSMPYLLKNSQVRKSDAVLKAWVKKRKVAAKKWLLLKFISVNIIAAISWPQSFLGCSHFLTATFDFFFRPGHTTFSQLGCF